MVDSWQVEVDRARVWLDATRREAEVRRNEVFRRVNAHLAFQDHQRALRSVEEDVNDANDDLSALSFLSDVDPEDMSALLQAEAASSAATTATTTTTVSTTVSTPVPTAQPAGFQPLEMPSHLITPPAQVHLSSLVTVVAKPAQVASVAMETIGMTLSSDENVNALMRHLQLDTSDSRVNSDVEEERKTEESTPPHVEKEAASQSISTVKDKVRRIAVAGQPANVGSKPGHLAKDRPDDKTGRSKPANAVDLDQAGDEMLSWVSGVRDPTVVRRKEELATRRRRQPKHYGAGSEEERRYIQQKVKHYTQDSDSDGYSPVDDNDYSPSEDPPEAEEPEEPFNDAELLSDDYLDSDDDHAHAKKKKRQKKEKKEKKEKEKKAFRRLKKAASSKKSTKTPTQKDKQSGQARSVDDADKQKRSAVVDLVSGGADETIDLRSSDDENMGDQDNRRLKDAKAGGISNLDNGKSPLVLRLKVPGSLQQQQDGGKEPSTSSVAATSSGVQVSEDDEGYETPEFPFDNELETEIEGGATALETPVAKQDENDGDVSDTGTVDFDFDQGEETEMKSSTAAADVANQHVSELALESTSKAPVSNTATIPAEDAEPGEVSDAGTEVLDEEDDSDDLGLNYSDDDDNDPVSMTEMGKQVSDVHQFFDYKPLVVKPAKVATRKTIPVHPRSDFIKKKGSALASTPVPSKTTEEKESAGSLPAPTGSNGLRPSKSKPVETSVTMKGKYASVRRAIKMVQKEDMPLRATNSAGARQARNVVAANGDKSISGSHSYAEKGKTGSNGLMKSTRRSSQSEGASEKAADKKSGRYLSYSGSKGSDDDDTPIAATLKPVTIRSRFGGGVADHPVASESGPGVISTGNGTKRQYRREPQLSIYQALDIEGKEDGPESWERDGVYKRPTAFKKLQEESARTGVPIVTGKSKEPDWDKIPIPKKGISFVRGDPDAKKKKEIESSSSQKPNRYGRENNESVSNGRGRPTQDDKYRRNRDYDENRRGSYHSAGKGTKSSRNDRRRSASQSPPRDRKRYKPSGDKGNWKNGGGKNRTTFSSSSPRGRDRDRPSHYGPRSRSPSPRSHRSSSADRDHKPVSTYRADRDPRKRSASPPRRDERGNGSSSSGVAHRGADPRDDAADDRMDKKRKITEQGRGHVDDSRDTSPPPGAFASFDDHDEYISASDSEIEIEMEAAPEDIRVDLDSVMIDRAVMTRRVYVTGFNPKICDEDFEEIFSPFGLETNRETGFASVEVYACQRTLCARGDACITFESEEGASTAVEELNLKHVKNSLISVRLMDEHTQRILNAQFEHVRDTWKCAGTHCRAEVSTWDNICPRCRRKRCFGPSNVKISSESWLCSVCFTANEQYDLMCKGCGESLPDPGRFGSYRN